MKPHQQVKRPSGFSSTDRELLLCRHSLLQLQHTDTTPNTSPEPSSAHLIHPYRYSRSPFFFFFFFFFLSILGATAVSRLRDLDVVNSDSGCPAHRRTVIISHLYISTALFLSSTLGLCDIDKIRSRYFLGFY